MNSKKFLIVSAAVLIFFPACIHCLAGIASVSFLQRCFRTGCTSTFDCHRLFATGAGNKLLSLEGERRREIMDAESVHKVEKIPVVIKDCSNDMVLESSELDSAICHDNTFLSLAHEQTGDGESTSTQTVVLLILNTPGLTPDLLKPGSSLFRRLWDLSSMKVCADGGANRLHDASVSSVSHKRDDFLPDLIRGDLDSLRDDVKDFYEKRGCKIQRDTNQDTNDLDKCLEAIESLQKQESIKKDTTVCVYGAFGGRFDQEMANINALFRWRAKLDRIILFSEETSAFLIPAGVQNTIIIDDKIEGPVCGIIPINGPALQVSTTGLKWNLDGDKCEFGGIVSSSNQVMPGEIVTIKSSNELIWTTEIKSKPVEGLRESLNGSSIRIKKQNSI